MFAMQQQILQLTSALTQSVSVLQQQQPQQQQQQPMATSSPVSGSPDIMASVAAGSSRVGVPMMLTTEPVRPTATPPSTSQPVLHPSLQDIKKRNLAPRLGTPTPRPTLMVVRQQRPAAAAGAPGQVAMSPVFRPPAPAQVPKKKANTALYRRDVDHVVNPAAVLQTEPSTGRDTSR